MVSERSYKHALKVIEQYKKEQIELQKDRLSTAEITLSTTLKELHSKKLVSNKLAAALYNYFKYNYVIERGESPKLEIFTDINEYSFGKWNQVGKKTVDEFIALMAAAGHAVPKFHE
jgi:hypothetical protein